MTKNGSITLNGKPLLENVTFHIHHTTDRNGGLGRWSGDFRVPKGGSHACFTLLNEDGHYLLELSTGEKGEAVFETTEYPVDGGLMSFHLNNFKVE